jgi:hypothetical protein
MSERDVFFERLPFLVNGTLGAADAQWMREQMALHPELQGEWQLAQSMRGQVRDEAQVQLRDVPADIGFAATQALIAREQGAASRPEMPSLWQRLRALLAAPAPQGWRLAQGLAMGLAIAFGVLLALPRPDAEHTEIRGTAPGIADGPLLRVNFDPAASETDLRLALIEARVLIVAGPTRLGDYYVKPAPAALQTARESLQRSTVVRRVEPVPGLPPEVLE